ncbi:MAG: ankyrin repeat domain-containing protein [Acidobacteriota bacterium]
MNLKQLSGWVMAMLLCAATVTGVDSNAPLADAAEEMDRARVRALLEQSVNVNAAQVDGMTALHWAAYQDDLETVKLLVEAGADVKATNRYGVTPLALACQNGNGPMVELLLDSGADPNAALPGGETALMTAARTGRMDPVRILISRGADVNAKETRHGQTALMWAAAEGPVEVVEELIKAGADFKTPLPSGFTPLLFAVRQGQIEVVKALLEAGADVNESVQPLESKEKGGYGRRLRAGTTPLLLAVSNAHYELGAFLLDAGAHPNANATGYTALHAIVPVRKPGVGDNDPAPEGSGNMTSIEFVKKLVAHGADVNAPMTKDVNLTNTRLNTMEATPFLLAAQTAAAELLRLLAELGADPLLPNQDNSTPLIVAAGLATRSPGEDAGTEEEVLETVELLLELGNDINAVDKHGNTAMHGAAFKNLPKVVKFLAEKGADIQVWNKKNFYGWTPLAIAAGYRFGNFKPSPVTMDAIREVMLAAGVTPPDKIVAETQQIY